MDYCYNSIEIESPIDAVWNTINNFHAMSWAENIIDSIDILGHINGHEVGAKRLFNHAFIEILNAVDPSLYNFTYTIDDGPGPIGKDSVTRYTARVSLSKTETATQVEWTADYQSNKDKAVADFCIPIYRALLVALDKYISSIKP